MFKEVICIVPLVHTQTHANGYDEPPAASSACKFPSQPYLCFSFPPQSLHTSVAAHSANRCTPTPQWLRLLQEQRHLRGRTSRVFCVRVSDYSQCKKRERKALIKMATVLCGKPVEAQRFNLNASIKYKNIESKLPGYFISLYLCKCSYSFCALITYWPQAGVQLVFLLSVQCTRRSAHPRSDLGEQAAAGLTPMCVRSDEIKARSPSEGPAQAEQRVATPFIFTRLQRHSCIVYTNTLQYTPVIEIKLVKVTCQICISRSTTGGEK